MPPRASTRARARKLSGKAADSDSVQVTPPTSPAIASVPPTPCVTRISPKKREAPADSPAVQMRAPPPTPAISRRLSFGTIEDDVVDSPPLEARGPQSSSSPRKPSARVPKVASAVAEEEIVATPVKNAKRKHESSPPSPSPASTVKASKKVALGPEELKRRRQANPAKRIRPMARLDSNDNIVIVGETRLATSSAGSLKENDLSGDEVDELWPDTPRLSLESKSLVLAMLDVEAEEAAEGDDEMEEDEEGVQDGQEEEEDAGVVSTWEDSPPPKRVEPKARQVQAKGKGRAKAQSGGKEPPLVTGVSKDKVSFDPLANIPPPVFAQELGSSADIFGSAVDEGAASDFNNSTAVDSESGLASKDQAEPLDEMVFLGFPPLLSDVVAYLRSSGIASRLHELVPKYTAHDEPEGVVPKLLDVLGMMRTEYAMPVIIDCLRFRGHGAYVNPLTADPAHFRIVNKKVMFKPSVKRLLYPVFVMPVVVQKCDLLFPTCTSERFQEERLRLTGWAFDEVFSLFSTFIGSVLNQNMVYAYMTESALQFTSRPAKAEATSVHSTPQKSTQYSLAFGRPSPRSINKSGKPVAQAARPPQFTHLRHPHSLGTEDTIPIYDGRSGHGDFRAEDRQWETISGMPRLGVPTPPPGQQPNYSCAVEIPPSERTKFCVALVAFTMGTYSPLDNPTAAHVSFNLQFAILLESWVSKLMPHAVTQQRIDALRVAAASQANTLAGAASSGGNS
ncbi:hypothetical protein PLEOSDRAFT_160920 [Pleurotus ostreatus PC15]|uniref:Uncharacterized protein n=1 Tax=Pleurotus ostreatus (strain PC15) TaxID=1137138 RepID=A0A067NAH9_PLEO1|nr:hypothetical protein PLEOSDRAFT_160920 [Pleurotus ostreatus PC15]